MKGIVNRTKVLTARRTDLWIETALAVASFILYLRTMPPTVLDGDGGEYQYMAYILGVPHSTGYPLYILLGKLFTFLPFGDVAYRVNLLSVVCAALTIPLIYALALRLIARRAPALVATLILALTPSVWGGALETKSYALHLLLGVLAMLLAVRWHQEGKPRDFYWLACVVGLGLTNHPIFRFLAPALALVAWLARARLTRAMVVKGILLGVLPLLLYAYIPIRANQLIAQQDPENWKLYTRADAMLKGTVTAYYNNTPQGFINLVSGFDNSYKIGFKSQLEEADRLNLATTLLFQQFGMIGIALAFAGAVVSFRRDRKTFSLLLALAVGIGFIATYTRALSTVYYFSLCYLALGIWSGFGVDALCGWAARVRRATKSRWIAAFAAPRLVVAILLLLPLGGLFNNLSRLDQSANYQARDDAQAVFRDNLAPNAVVIAPWEVSQPMRYFQFVENQRPDLLVVNVSPIWPQFITMLTNARARQRPFYNVEFNPEDPSARPRAVQAVPLPLTQEPRPRYALNDARIVPAAQVIGYDLDPDPPQPGKPARVLIYYRTLARMYPMYSAMLTVNDITGKTWGEYTGFPASRFFATYRWQAGDVYRDAWTINLPADAPAGLYTLDLSWFVYDLETHRSDYDHENKIALGVIRVGDLSATRIAHPHNTRVGDALVFLGWSGDAVSVARGQTFNLDLFWRADRAVSEAYTVFAHLTDASGRVLADADSPPASGLFPTQLWKPGEDMRDHHVLKIPADLAPGNYSIEIGMYLAATGVRLPIQTATDRADKIVLTQVSVR